MALGGLNAGVNNMDKHLPEKINEFYNFFEYPNISAEVGVGLNLETNTGIINISEINIDQNIELAEKLDFKYYLDLRMSLDLRPVFDYLLGAESIQTKDNKSQIFIELSGSKFGDAKKVLIGLYYVGGKLYLDMGNFGINPVAVDIDLYDMILSLILKGKNSAIQINPSGDAQAAGDTAAVKAKTALEIAVMLSSESLRLEVVKGLSELLFNLVGISAGGIEAALEIAWGNVKENHDGKYLAFDVTVKDTSNHEVGGAQLYIDKLGLGIGQSVEGIKIDRGDDDSDPTTPNAFQPLVDYLADRNYDGKADNEFEIANIFDKNGDLALKQVYVELGATIFLNAFAGGDSQWELGDWIAAILGQLAGKPGGVALTPAQTSFITNLILNFDIGREIGTEIGLRIAAVARFNPKDAIADVKENVVFALNSDDISTFIGELYKKVNGSYILLTSLEIDDLIASRKVKAYKQVGTGATATYQLLGNDLYSYNGAVFYQNADGTTYTEFTADALKLRKLQVYSKGYESAGNKFVEIPKAELATYTGDRFASINRNGKQTYVKIEASKVATYTEKVFKIDASFDIAYLLSHSDLVLDIFNKNLTEATEENRILGIKLIYEGEKNGMPSSTIYIDLGKDTHIAIPGINLTSLFAKNAAAPAGALVAAETPPTPPTDPTTPPTPTPPSTLDKVMSIISGALYGIFVDSNQLKVQIAPQFLSVLLGMILSVD
ncbi:MAG: hypothetical protein RSC44_01655, partial [Clostridia bacterium]